MPAALSFRAVLEPGGPSFMPTQIILVPAEVLAALGGKATKRIVVTIGGQALRLGLLPLEGGGRYLMLNKDVCRTAGIAMGQELTIGIAPDPKPRPRGPARRASRSPRRLAHGRHPFRDD